MLTNICRLLLIGLFLIIWMIIPYTVSAISWESYVLGEDYALSEASDAVVKTSGESIVFFGNSTGFLISPEGHIITNHHVYLSFGEKGTVYRKWEGAGATPQPLKVKLSLAAPTLDIAVYQVVDAPTKLPFLKIRSTKAEIGEEVFILGHPKALPVRVSFGEVLANGLTIANIPSVEYSAQTWWGSSGSPVITRAGEVIAVHWGWDSQGTSNGRLTGVPLARIIKELPEIKAIAKKWGAKTPK